MSYDFYALITLDKLDAMRHEVQEETDNDEPPFQPGVDIPFTAEEKRLEVQWLRKCARVTRKGDWRNDPDLAMFIQISRQHRKD